MITRIPYLSSKLNVPLVTFSAVRRDGGRERGGGERERTATVDLNILSNH